MSSTEIQNAAEIIRLSKHCMAFTGAGVSVESGIPPFRGENSIWSRYDPSLLELRYFKSHPETCWPVIKEIFYDFFGKAKPNAAHYALAKLEQDGIIRALVTQNIDNLHQEAGSREVYEFHGNSQRLVCLQCDFHEMAAEADLSVLPLYCPKCGGLMKPDFIFFGEQIPEKAYQLSMGAARKSDVCIVVGSTGEVMPAALIPAEAKRSGAVIIEINPEESLFTRDITDIHLRGKASEIFGLLNQYLK
ncbi:NAD-dependent deacylase [Alkaliflexus imshenetskii]|uniref:NAD-dependent deacylase n=1 Tax=Alkaliflexus imshenetskii TaxID=286730 RepID=UPI00047B3027|nr:NAD-dependent deacylase [Alkaliflexus imshenetskii]